MRKFPSRRVEAMLVLEENEMSVFEVNGSEIAINAEPDTPLLWVLREHLKLTGTKYGCGIGQCGACMVHVDGQTVYSCLTPVGSVDGKKITTIEGLSQNSDHPLQKAWIDLEVPQCGYCQSGQIMRAAMLLASNADPSHDEIVSHMSTNLCRCSTYPTIIKAIKQASREVRNGG